MRIEDEKFLAALVLALGVVLAFQFESLANFFVPFLVPSLFFVMVFSLLPYINYSKDTFTKIHPAVLPLVGLQQLILPAIVALGGQALGIDSQILFFVMITLTSGSLFASPALVHLMGLDQKLAVQTVVVSTLMAPISIFVGFSLLHGSYFSFDIINFVYRLAGLMILPLAIFFAIHRLAQKWEPHVRDQCVRAGRWGAVLSLTVFCFALEAPVVAALKTDSGTVAYYLLVSVITTLAVAFTVKLVMGRMGYSIAVTASVLASFRNIGLTFGLVGYGQGSDLAIYVGASQIPMFFAPLMFEFLFGRTTRSSTGNAATPDLNKSTAGEPESINHSGPMDPAPIGRGGIATKSMAALTSSTSVAISGGALVGSTAQSAAVAENLEKIEAAEPVQQPETKLEDARVLIDRLEDQYAEKPAEEPAHVWSGMRFAMVTLGLFLVGMAAIWQGNKYFAPMLFDQKMIAEVAQTHVEGKNFAVFDLNINIRDLRNETIKRMKKTPDVGILGASHWQEAHVDGISEVNVYNSHIHRDYYEDMMAMVEIYERHNKLPKELIITIRDKLLTPVEDRTDFLWLPGIKYYQDFAARTGYPAHSPLKTLPIQTWRELVNFPLLKTHGSRHLAAPVMPHATSERNFETLDTLLPDGSILWSGEHKRLFSQERARKEALAFAEASKNSPPKIDPKGVAHMEFLFDYLKKKGVKVTLTHPQFNPIFWDAVQNTDYMVGLNKIKDLTRSWADKYGFGLVGGFAPEDVGCKASQYIDAEHGDPACLAMLLKQFRHWRKVSQLRSSI